MCASQESEKCRQDLVNYLARLQRKHAPAGETPPETRVSVEEPVEAVLDATFPPGSIDADQRARLKESHLEAFREARSAELPSEWEHPYVYWILRQIETHVRAVIDELGLELSTEVAVGSLPTGSLNAMASPAPLGGVAVLVNQGTHLFLYKMAQVVAEFLKESESGDFTVNWPSGGTDAPSSLSLRHEDLAEALETNELGHERFRELLSAYRTSGDAGYAQSYHSAGCRGRLVGLLSYSSDLFVVAHEFAHVVRGHVPGALRRRVKLPSGLVLIQLGV